MILEVCANFKFDCYGSIASPLMFTVNVIISMIFTKLLSHRISQLLFICPSVNAVHTLRIVILAFGSGHTVSTSRIKNFEGDALSHHVT